MDSKQVLDNNIIDKAKDHEEKLGKEGVDIVMLNEVSIK